MFRDENALLALETAQMDPAFQSKSRKNDEDEPAEVAVEGGPGKSGEDRIGDEGFVEAGAGGGVGRRHVIEWYDGMRLLRHVVGKDKLQAYFLAFETGGQRRERDGSTDSGDGGAVEGFSPRGHVYDELGNLTITVHGKLKNHPPTAAEAGAFRQNGKPTAAHGRQHLYQI